ncbi:MAG TPA: PilN domain-containing protein [Candidatus Omnitrophota bacterium]|nr:PilN domain-containing protein [Candidatus Omnitrophota bacterium]HRZ15655.1 PilN domain-containing protein [Candidatus Omnitrophota bacterium]
MRQSGICLYADAVSYAHVKTGQDGRAVLEAKSFPKDYKPSAEKLTLVIPRNEVHLRYLDFPSVNETEIRKMLAFEAADIFPFKPEEMIVDCALAGESANGYSRVMLWAVLKDAVAQKLSRLKELGAVPDAITVSAVSLFNQAVRVYHDDKGYLLVYVDAGAAEILYIKNKRLELSRAILAAAGTPAQESTQEEIARVVGQTIAVLADQEQPLDELIVGGASEAAGLAGALEEKLRRPVRLDTSLTSLGGLAVPGGIRINLLPQETRQQKDKALRVKAMVYFAALVLLNISLLGNIVFVRLKAKVEYLELLKKEIKRINAPATALQQKMLKAQALQKYVFSGRQMLNVFAELYRAAPEGILLTSLDISQEKDAGKLVMAGQSRDSESVLKFADNLKGSALVKKADVTYITKRNLAGSQIADFEIRAEF